MKDTTANKSLSDAQRRKIFLEAKKAGFSEKALHDYIMKEWNLDSIKLLSKEQGAILIAFLIKTKKSVRKQFYQSVNSENVVWLATVDQVAYIKKLADDRGWDLDHLEAWLNKYQKVEGLRYLRKSKASKVISILQKMVRSKRSKAAYKSTAEGKDK